MIEDIFKKIGDEIIVEMKTALPKVSGKTANSLELKVTPTSLEIWGDKTIGAIIEGRKPTKAGAKQTGEKTVQQSVLEWIKLKGITPKESSMSQESLSWAISKSIHKNGYKGKPDLFKNIVNKSKIDSISEMVLNSQIEATSNILTKLNFD